MVHHTTTNLSFLKLYHILTELGIKNSTFFLTLYDRSLLDVDPFDENLTDEQISRIIYECTINPWYFLREAVRVPASGISKFEIHRGNLALIWAVLNNIDVYNILPRQSFKTFSIAAIILWIMYFGGYRTEIMLYANSDPNLKNNMSRVRALRDYLPKYLQFHDNKMDKDSDDNIYFSGLGNSIKKKAPGRSVEASVNVGRGFSTPIQWYDEFAFIPNIYHQYTASVFGHMEVAKRAEENGLPHSRILTTTAGYLNTAEGKYTFKFLRQCADFNEILYDMTEEQVKQYIVENSQNGFLRVEFMYYDLGKRDNYLEEQKKAVFYDQDAIDREILNMWKDVSKEHPLGQQTVALLDSHIREPNKIIVINEMYFLKLYRDIDDIEWDIPYVIGEDCSGNVGKDFTTLTVIDPRNFEVVATMRTNLYSTARFGKAVLKIMNSIFPNSILVPERNAMGIAVIDNMIESDYMINSRIYHDPKDGVPGMKNTKATRPLLYNELLKTSVTEDYNKIHDRAIINEVHTLTRTRSGRIDHMPGEHDDMLMSYLIARWFLTYGEKLSRYLPPTLIGISTTSKSENKGQDMENIKNEERSDMRSVLYGKDISPKRQEKKSKLDSPLLAQFEEGSKGSSFLSSEAKISRYLTLKQQDSVSDSLDIIDDVDEIDDDENYDKSPGDIEYTTRGLSTQQELDRKLGLSDIEDMKKAIQGSVF